MQTALPSTLPIAEPATYNFFDAPNDYRQLNQKPPKVVSSYVSSISPSDSHFQPVKEVQYQISNNPNGGTLIQTETPSRFEAGSFRHRVGNLTTRISERIGFANDTSSRWGLYQIPEPLFGEFRARVINGLSASSGYLFISQGHLCFSSFTDKTNRAMKLIVPFQNIVRIGLAHRLRNTPGTAINLTPLTSMSLTADAIQIYTRDGITHQFFGLKKKTESLYNLLNHTWGLATGVIPINPANQNRTLELQHEALYSQSQYGDAANHHHHHEQLVQGQTHYAHQFPDVPAGNGFATKEEQLLQQQMMQQQMLNQQTPSGLQAI
ncbi:hypothetical protein PROFUN_02697 [Planoprotostelium fungivorum]|uniref:GRAM domain-containing protein n=1 Tax=Planoprotostelium fungivorum TaxID=1890364 RepID=A0A2P6NVJ2_9EUKA|nr:hypothetical protein PROFUN_02697 [Planoprotostelium fungivorum]